ncbi:MAG: type II toxin-antitoxin system HicA family toxin [Gammaproteobacteria bacterium]|nr:type II toxin-antitoxin system HicA family toxin [Gammaproteobacteria bacterium]MCY4337606.1 type II toxin-antitoxin system HicA family toxin [Gammaproteobacteria bacterium]
MSKVPVLKPQEVMRLLISAGFKETRRRGSHRQFRHPDGRATTIPFHKGRDISPILLRQVAKDIELTLDKFLGGNFD